MSTMWPDDTDFEAAEYDDSESAEYDDSEAGEFADTDLDTDFEGEDYDAESRASRRRRAQQRRVALARRRQAQVRARSRARGRPMPTRTTRAPAPKSTVAAIRNLDLESKVAEDSFRRALSTQGKQVSRSEYVAVTGAAVNQAIESFGGPDNVYARAALRFAPLLLLSPQKKGTGFAAFIKDPRVIGGAAVAGVTFLGDRRNKDELAEEAAKVAEEAIAKLPKEVKVTSVPEMQLNDSVPFFADVINGRGEVIPGGVVKWVSTDPAKATVDPDTGQVTAVAKGPVFITAEVAGIPIQRVPLIVS